MSLKMMRSVVIDLLCISQSCVLSKSSTKNFLSTGEAFTWNMTYVPHTPTVSTLFFPYTKMYFFLIKMNQLTCKITVLMFLSLEKLCSMQMVSQTCTGENTRQQKQTNKQANQKNVFPFNSLRYDSIFN